MFEDYVKNHELIELLRSGGIAVIRTDTIYGLVASADIESAVERVYAVKGRDANKSCIVLLDDMRSAYGRGDELRTDELTFRSDVPTSFLINGSGAPSWLVRENQDLAYRVPQSLALRQFLAKTGPLIAPSANPQGQPPALSAEQAKVYFGDLVDLYVDGGSVDPGTKPSRLIRVHDDGHVETLR